MSPHPNDALLRRRTRRRGRNSSSSPGPPPQPSSYCRRDDDDDDRRVVASGGGGEGDEKKWTRLLAGVAGNVLEWYDFAVFGYFSDVIADVFFPPGQEGHRAVAESFAVFGGAFVMRPLGGVLMGYIGDKFGRKLALELSIFLMAVPTFLMGCLPSYDAVGPWAVVLLAAVRLLQGLSAGGQIMSSLVFTVESAPRHQWGLYGSLVMATGDFGTLLGGVVGVAVRAALTPEQLRSWGWRVPFLCGILAGGAGIYLKFYCEEEEERAYEEDAREAAADPSEEDINHEVRNPVVAAFARGNRRSLVCAWLVTALWGGGFYLTFVWMGVYTATLEEHPLPHAFLINSLSCLFSVCLLFQVAGILSDLHGRRRIMLLGGVGTVLLSPLLFEVVGYGDPLAAFFAQTSLGILLSLWGAPMCAWLVESFPPAVRLTSVAVGYNLAMATVGGFAPAAATLCIDRFGTGKSVGYVLSAIAALSVIALLCAPPRRRPERDQKSGGRGALGEHRCLGGGEQEGVT